MNYCYKCKFNEEKKKECRRHSPPFFEVRDFEWCGEFKPRIGLVKRFLGYWFSYGIECFQYGKS